MRFLDWITFPNDEQEFDFFLYKVKRQCYDTFYPFKILSKHRFERIDFEPVTILYGGNGSGKTTALNVIAGKLGAGREAAYNRSSFFQQYLDLCRFAPAEEMEERYNPADLSRLTCIITSDDIFDYMLNIRSLNEGIDRRREELFDEYLDLKYSSFQMKTLEDYEQLKRVNLAKSRTQSKFVRKSLMDNVREYSNGESAWRYFMEKIEGGKLYLLDEPENSLSPARQQDLADFLVESARDFDCQFIIATHSPFLLAMRGAKIYDLDDDPVYVKRWTELSNVRQYYEFFRKYAGEFERNF